MKNANITVGFDDAKLEALNIFMSDKNTELKNEMETYIEQLYKKYVPQSVREFIEKKEQQSVPENDKLTRRNNGSRGAVTANKTGTHTNTHQETKRGKTGEFGAE